MADMESTNSSEHVLEEASIASFPLDGVDISQVSDETLIELFDTAPVLHSYGATHIVRLSQTLILKGGVSSRPCEANIMRLIAKAGEKDPSKNIPVPKVHRILNIQPEELFGCQCLVVMDFVPGRTVEQAWDDLNATEREDIITQVASIITTLQSIELSEDQLLKPGSVGRADCVAQGFTFTDLGAGPFESKADLEGWFNLRLEITQEFHQAPDTVPPFRFDKLVLAHLDITPRNLILGPDGTVWLIDWGNAEVFPDGFEVASLLHRKSQALEYTEMLLERLPDMVPKHEGLLDQLRWIRFALTTGQYLGRRRLHFGRI